MRLPILGYSLALIAIGPALAQNTFADDRLVTRDPFMIAWNPFLGHVGSGVAANPKNARKNNKKSKDKDSDDEDNDDDDDDKDDCDTDDDGDDDEDDEDFGSEDKKSKKKSTKKQKKKNSKFRSKVKKPAVSRRDDLQEVIYKRDLYDLYESLQ